MEFKIMKQGALINISLVIVLLAIAAFTGLVTYFLNKGFELSDESYYLLCTKYPFDTKLLVSAFGLVNHRLCFGINDLFSLRLFKLIYQLLFLMIFARVFFVYAIRKFGTDKKNTMLLSLVIIVAGFANYDYLPMTLSYNSWSLNFGLLFWAGLLFAHISASKRGLAFSHLLMGSAVVFLFYTKAPNAIVLAFVFVLYVFIFQKGNILNSFLLFCLGNISGIIILFLSYDTFSQVTGNLLYNILNTRQAPPMGYFKQMGDLISIRLGYTFILVQACLIGLMYLFRKKNIKKSIGIALILINTIFIYYYFKGNSADVSNEFVVFGILGINCIAITTLMYNGELNLKRMFIPVFLILTPFMLAAGTSNPIFYTSSQMFVFSLTGLFLLLLMLEQKEMQLFYAYCSLFVCLSIGSFLVNGMIRHPYRQTDLSKKSTLLDGSELVKDIFESAQRSLTIDQSAQKLRLCNSSKLPVLSSPSMLGTILLTEMRPFAVCWICDPDNEAMSNDEYFKKVDLRNNKPFLMITKGMFNSELQNKIFKNGGMDLKYDYVIKDSMYLEWNDEYYYLMQPVKNV